MEKQFDELLRHALTPIDEPNWRLNQEILKQVQEPQEMMQIKKRKFSIAVAIAVLILGLSSVTVYAALKYLSPSDAAGEIQDTKLSDVFLSDQTLIINGTQSYGGYNVTLLGIVSGEMLSKYPHYDGNGSIITDRTYAVVAIENYDGTPMPDVFGEACEKSEFFASPLIGGYNPALYNIASMSGNYSDIVEDGILYRLLECDNVEIFADHDLYLCVSDGTFYNTEAYQYDEITGKISRNENYQGLNALFELPIEDSKANPEEALEYIASLNLESDLSKEKLNINLDETFEVEVTKDNVPGAEAARYALQFVGNPYAWAGDSLTEGTDSSGFTKSVYEHFDIILPHSSAEQRELGYEVKDLQNAQPGDLIFYETPAHVAIYIGDGMIVHAMPETGICVSEADFDDILIIRRIN